MAARQRTEKRVGLAKDLAGLQQLARAIVGEARFTLAEANRQGYYTTEQIAAAIDGATMETVQRGIRRAPQAYERVRLIGSGGAYAYRLR